MKNKKASSIEEFIEEIAENIVENCHPLTDAGVDNFYEFLRHQLGVVFEKGQDYKACCEVALSVADERQRCIEILKGMYLESGSRFAPDRVAGKSVFNQALTEAIEKLQE